MWNYDDDDDDHELFLRNGWPTKGIKPCFQPGSMSKILAIASLQYTASSIWTCPEPELGLSLMKLCSSDNYYSTATQQPSNNEIITRTSINIRSSITIWYRIIMKSQIIRSRITISRSWIGSHFRKRYWKCLKFMNHGI